MRSLYQDAGSVHHEFIAAVFHTEPPLSAAEQREGFQAALSGALDDSFNMEVVQAVHEQLLDKIEQHKESKDPEPLTVSVQEVAAILKDCGSRTPRSLPLRHNAVRSSATALF